MKRALVFALLLATSILVAQDQATPIKFRGAYIGQSIADYVDCSTGKAKVLDKSYKAHGDLCQGKSGAVWHTKMRGTMTPRVEGEMFNFDNKSLSKITIMFADDDWDKLRYDLTEKLGEPRSESPEVYQNLFGARFEFPKGFWRKGDIAALAATNVETWGGCRASDVLVPGASNRPCAKGMKVIITSAAHAGTPDTRKNTLE